MTDDKNEKIPENLLPYMESICGALRNALMDDEDTLGERLIDKLVMSTLATIVSGKTIPMTAEVRFDENGVLFGFMVGGNFNEGFEGKTPEELWAAVGKAIFALEQKKSEVRFNDGDDFKARLQKAFGMAPDSSEQKPEDAA